ncbi:MAG: sulfide/dihydroorotate dehydrogenase-like FAD/NAD-binding protein [Ruminococcus sp.]|jgi:ferredoxin--NADP+ reductase|nr:sulfide/dihydroorotate dehydrogenase-like FAD/NAD-binding protein [Ruminococcus sp.]
MNSILRKEKLTDTITLLELNAPLIAKSAKAGQFVIVRPTVTSERIPLTIADANKNFGTIQIVFQEVGHTTQKLASLRVSDVIEDTVGPLGKPTEIPKDAEKVCIVAGGVGAAMSYSLAKLCPDADIVLGFRNKSLVILEDKFRSVCKNVTICTDDGSYGEKGFVTDFISNKYDFVMATGPIPMMKAVCDKTSAEVTVSLNPIMIDGTGMCGCCRVTVDGKVQYACIDGPDFDGHKVDFNELINRNKTYKKYEEECNLLNR